MRVLCLVGVLSQVQGCAVHASEEGQGCRPTLLPEQCFMYKTTLFVSYHNPSRLPHCICCPEGTRVFALF